MQFAGLNDVEGDLDDDLRFDDDFVAFEIEMFVRGTGFVRRQPMGLEPGRHLLNFDIGQAAVGFTDYREFVAVANREGVIGKDVDATSVSAFHRDDDAVERRQLALELEPRFTPSSGCVR